MIWQHIAITVRNFKVQWKFSVLNISGLALGLVLTIMMVMLIRYELSFDTFHPKRDKIHKVVTHDLKSGEIHSHTPMPLSLTLQNDFPEVEHVAGIWQILNPEAKIQYERFEHYGFTGASVESGFFDIFNYPVILGDGNAALDDPGKIAVSRHFATKIFGRENPVGKHITYNNFEFTIGAVFDDIPDNSEVKFDVLFSEKIRKLVWEKFPVAWWSGGMHTYVILHKGTSIEQFNERLKLIPEKYFPDFLKGRETFFTVPFKGLHFRTDVKGGLVPAVSPVYLFILGAIAIITLVIACINFINISTCQITKRNKDIAIRKINGAGRRHIMALQLWHSVLSAVASVLLAIPVSNLLLPYFNSVVQRPVSSHFMDPSVWAIIFFTLVIIVLLTGWVPGYFYSKISPIQAIQLKIKAGSKTNSVRNIFVIAQFSITILLITTQFFILRQISFMRNADLGFNNENLLAIHVNTIEEDSYLRKYEIVTTYKNELEKYGAQFGFGKGVITENIPGFYYQNTFTLVPVDGNIDECLVTSTAIDENFLEVYEIPMAEGRFFSKQLASDKSGFMINETLMKQIGWESCEGKYMRYHHEGVDMPVIGVVKDIHTTTLKEKIGPMVYRFGQHNNSPGFITFRLTGPEKEKTIAFMEQEWLKMFPDAPFVYFDVKERYFQNYAEEERLSKIVGSFALLAIVLSALGLIGLITFFTNQRTKEIGIRKVNGAKIWEVMLMLNIDFVKWVAIAFVIATPIAYYAMSQWLQNFAYKTELSWWIFALAGLLALGIALLTVSWQSWRAARRNPVEALRYE
jgi:putative ABC transport system permease protein